MGGRIPVDAARTTDDFLKAIHPDFAKHAAQPLHDFIEDLGMALVKSDSATLKYKIRDMLGKLAGQEMVSDLDATMRSAHTRPLEKPSPFCDTQL